MFQHHADRATGIDASDLPEFWQWAKANHKGQLQDALSKQMHGRDLSGYKTLAQRYMAETPPTEQALMGCRHARAQALQQEHWH